MNRRQFLLAGAATVVSAYPGAKLAAPVVSRYVHRTVALAYAIPAVPAAELAAIGDAYARHLARSLVETRAVLGAHILTRAFNP